MKKTKICTAVDLEDATKSTMTDWIMKSPKLGKKLKRLGYTDYVIWRSFQTMNKDFLSAIITAAM